MRLRTAHFACLLMLLSTLGVADAFALPPCGQARVGQYAGSLLSQRGAAHLLRDTPREPHALAASDRLPAVAAPVSASEAWLVRPPVAHSATVHAVTGLRR